MTKEGNEDGIFNYPTLRNDGVRSINGKNDII